MIIYGPYMIIYGPYMIIYGPYMIIYGSYMIIYACTTIKMHVPCPTWLSSLARNTWALAPTGGPGGLAPQAGVLGGLRPSRAAGGFGGLQAPQGGDLLQTGGFPFIRSFERASEKKKSKKSKTRNGHETSFLMSI